MANINLNIEIMESSAPGDSKVGSCSEAPHTGAAGQHLDEQSTSGTPLIGVERLPVSDLSLENLEGLTEKVGTLGLQTTRKRKRRRGGGGGRTGYGGYHYFYTG
jgi:hypothetical protein